MESQGHRLVSEGLKGDLKQAAFKDATILEALPRWGPQAVALWTSSFRPNDVRNWRVLANEVDIVVGANSSAVAFVNPCPSAIVPARISFFLLWLNK